MDLDNGPKSPNIFPIDKGNNADKDGLTISTPKLKRELGTKMKNGSCF